MHIPITFGSPSTRPKLPPSLVKISHDEVVLIELQGVLETSGEGSEKDGQLVGNLEVDISQGKAKLLIGHHLLEGKIASLPKPLAVLQRRKRRLAQDPDPELDEQIPTENDWAHDRDEQVSWDAIAVVKRKIIFSKRPTPIVTGPGKVS